MATINPMLNTAIRAARRAGKLMVRYLDRLDQLTIESKGRNDFVSEVDRLAEAEIIDIIQRAYPRHAIIAEESGAQGQNEYEWIIDPLDGTTNYLHGHPQFAVSIGLRHRGRLDQAVVFDPLRNELFTASRGGGAQLNDKRIRVSDVTRLENALLGTGFPFRVEEHLDIWVATFRDLFGRSRGIRRAGSAALDLAYVACGRFDGFWEMGLSIWDMAGGCLLIEEAGGLVGDFSGEQDHLDSGNIIATNANLFGDMLELIQKQIPPDA